MENQEQNNNLQETQEIDYKAEYERMITEKEREETIEYFKESIDEHGYKFDEEIFESNCSKYSNQELRKFEEMLGILQPHQKIGFITIGAPEPTGQQYVERKATFEEYIDSKRNGGNL